MIFSNIKMKKKMLYILVITGIILLGLIMRIAYLQFIEGEELKLGAYEQQTLDRKITPKRGTIYDATGENILATSASVETVTINPVNIDKNKKEDLINAFCNIFDLEREEVSKKVNKKSSIETIVTRCEKEQTDELRKWLEDNNITKGVNIDEDSKRYYPYGSLASHVIGFCGSDNQGLDGIESEYDELLRGTKGKILKVTDAKGGEIGGEKEEYIEPIDGDSLVLTIDLTIQSIAEKYLKQACIDNECTDGGNMIIMNPKTGDILAMATYPSYNLNTPYEINSEELKNVWDSMSKNDRISSLQQMWRNKAIADAYEPGSTFKLITASAALEEGITTPDKEGEFSCVGYIEVAGVRIRCWRYYRPHGSESLRQALMNSCNPVFIGLGQKIGKEKYYEYLKKFGLFEKTGITLPGEAGSIFLKEAKVGPVELATISFGQRFKVTPIQLITAVSAIANKGIRVSPRLVKQSINSQTGEVTEYPVKEVERVLSEETANNIIDMMGSVVSEGTGKGAQVKGYTVGGKTGTSEDGVNTGKYVASFMGVTPVSDPELVILITLYNPTGEGGHQGGGIAAPLAGEVLTDVLAYLEVNKDNQKEEDIIKEVEVPEIREKTIKEAKSILKEQGLELVLKQETEEDINDKIVKEQMPKPRNYSCRRHKSRSGNLIKKRIINIKYFI